jgi:GR25 family glycosyltransferase involved in LPS biosynthesis
MDKITLYIVILVLFVLGGMIFNKIGVENFIQGPNSGTFTMENFDVYLINLERNAERLEFFIEQYMKSDLRYKQFQRINAVDGSALNIKEHISDVAFKEIMQIEKTGYRTKHYQLTRGAIGCYLSHLKAYELIASGDKEYGFIFEDDAVIDPTLLGKLNKVIKTMDDTWDMLILGCICIVCDTKDTYYDINRFFLLHGCVVKKSAAIKLVNMLKEKKITQQIDSEISDLISQGHLKVYCLKDKLSQQFGFETDIQTPLKVIPGINPYTSLI